MRAIRVRVPSAFWREAIVKGFFSVPTVPPVIGKAVVR